jgi:hypothetical protein
MKQQQYTYGENEAKHQARGSFQQSSRQINENSKSTRQSIVSPAPFLFNLRKIQDLYLSILVLFAFAAQNGWTANRGTNVLFRLVSMGPP